MFSWRPSSLSQARKPLLSLLFTGSAVLLATPALARNRSHGRPSNGNNPPPASNNEAPKSNSPVVVPGCGSDATITIATYNVENFWDDIAENSGAQNYDEYKKDGSNWYSGQMAKAKAQSLAEAIRMAGAPDIVAMQEFESANNTSRSLEILKPYVESMGYKYFALGQQNPKNPVAITTAVMSKFPITKNDRLDFAMKEGQISGHSLENDSLDSMNSSARDPQVVTIDVKGQPVRIYTAHWKSRRGDRESGNAMRLATAELIKQDIDDQKSTNANADILVMGDFNSDYNERPLQYGMNSTDDKNHLKLDLASDKMFNLWFELPSSERCSYMHSGELQCLDHMLVNSSLFDGKGIDLVEQSFQVIGHNGGEAAQKLLRNDGRTPNRWGMQKNNGRAFFTGTGYSDHLPLVATFKIPSLCKATR
ncbi:MAG: endonuclease/exonuclease/phosphatase family protein [Silvanigrellaceae bacterium]